MDPEIVKLLGETGDFQAKINRLQEIFDKAKSAEDKYRLLIQFGQQSPILPEELRSPDTQVSGCQSLTFVKGVLKNEKIFFSAFSEALISRGLAALLIFAYSGETALFIIQNPPRFFQEMGLHSALSLNRSQGASYIYLKMREQALALLIQNSHSTHR